MKFKAWLQHRVRGSIAPRWNAFVQALNSLRRELHKPDLGHRFLEGGLKLLVALFLTGGAAWYAVRETAAQNHAIEVQKLAPVTFTPQNLEKAIVGMKETNETLISWSLLILGGTVGITILAKGAKIRDRRWAMTLIPAAWMFLGASLSNGSDFKRSLTYQLATGRYNFPDLNVRLYLQMHFFLTSLVMLGSLAAVYLFFRFSLLEEKNGGDE